MPTKALEKSPKAGTEAKKARASAKAKRVGDSQTVGATATQAANGSAAVNNSVSTTASEQVKRPRSFEDVIGELTGPPREIARQLRQLVFDMLPGVIETPFGRGKGQMLLYSIGGLTKTVCGIQPNDRGCLLYLHHITPDDSQILLVEGETKHSHHVCVDAMTNLVVRDLRRLLTLSRRRAKS